MYESKERGAASAGTRNSASTSETMTENGRTVIITEKWQQLQALSELLPEGRKNAISMRELSKRLMIDERETRRRVSDARKGGALICADNAGYYRPQSREELRRYYARTRKRAMSCLVDLQGVKRALEQIEGQQSIKTKEKPKQNQKESEALKNE